MQLACVTMHCGYTDSYFEAQARGRAAIFMGTVPDEGSDTDGKVDARVSMSVEAVDFDQTVADLRDAKNELETVVGHGIRMRSEPRKKPYLSIEMNIGNSGGELDRKILLDRAKFAGEKLVEKLVAIGYVIDRNTPSS